MSYTSTDQPLPKGKLLKFYCCGICECFHPFEWDGDCREDANRFAADELDTAHGSNGWEEVPMPGTEGDCPMTYLEFIRGQLGANWVVARRTSRILARYGEDVVCISQQRMRAIDKEYRRLYGDPNDKVRAQMYLALLRAKNVLEFNGVHLARADHTEICAAIKAEQERP